MFPLTTSRLIIRTYSAGDITEQVDAVIESVMTVGRWLPWCHSSYSVKDAAEWFVICEQSMSANISYDLGIFDKSTGELEVALLSMKSGHITNSAILVTGCTSQLKAEELPLKLSKLLLRSVLINWDYGDLKL